MNLIELKNSLNSLTIKQLKDICVNRRLWGVYSTRTAYTGYSKCKNKQDLINFIIDYHQKQEITFDYVEDREYTWKSFWKHERTFKNYSINNSHIDDEPLFSVMYCKLNKRKLY